MKRSEINIAIQRAIDFFAAHSFHLPAFAHWSLDQWRKMGSEVDEIRGCKLGWDVTDFGSGQFAKQGLVLFTLRNGITGPNAPSKTYCEKIMLVGEGQITPFHFHWIKTEDIINRGGGRLVVELYRSDDQGEFTNDDIEVSCDGIRRNVAPGGKVILAPGESITLPPRLYHQFHAEAGSGAVMVGEVSSVNDDSTDNRFKNAPGRFPAIEEDEPPRWLLCHEYSS